MQKKIIALAVAAAITSIAASSAFADTTVTIPSLSPNVTIYGLLDYGYLNQGGNSGAVPKAGSTSSFNSGISEDSRIGIKGFKDLGNGTKAIFELEYGLAIDNNGAQSNSSSTPFYNRHSYVGATGGWGTALGGRLEGARYSFEKAYDAFGGGTVGNFGSLIGNQARADNAVAYVSPTFGGGFSVLTAYTTKLTGPEASANYNDARLYAIAPQYNNGAFSATYDYEDATLHGTGGDIKINVLGASYDLTSVKFFGYAETVKTSGPLVTFSGGSALNMDQTAWNFGVTAPVSDSIKLKFSYGDVKQNNLISGKGSNDCSKTSFGADYKYDKDITFYADVASISNQANATCTISTSSANYSGAITGLGAVDSTVGTNHNGVGTRGFDIGGKFAF